ncbi:MAG: flagellar protein export ATPase FliI [Candidatus Marinimicrobia bacterium]|jgi:flagellum-specific ATP synthase|nr:flagellar protein export ATPase FliI [Candidatus Neomarinimicrobiota bacterium]
MELTDSKFGSILDSIDVMDTVSTEGRISQIIGLVIEASGLEGSLGELCSIRTKDNRTIQAEIVGFKGDKVLMMPFGEIMGISPGSPVSVNPQPMNIQVGDQLLGRVLDGMGNPIDGKGPINGSERQPVYNVPPNPLDRQRITEVISTGIRSIDGFLTLGKGQRIGIFSGSGIGKSILLGMISRFTSAEVNVIALIGERGREVREFIERDLGPEGLKRSVVIVATSDQSAMVRIKASLIATAIAEYYRDQGKNVMFMMDSLTRVALAQREIGLAVGEPPTTKGFTPSVFSFLPRLLERTGAGEKGSITGLYSVLVEGDDMDDPVSDTARSILDGHIILSRKLSTKGHYPAVDVLDSVSRLFQDITDEKHYKSAGELIELLSEYREAEDMLSIGAYAKGSNPKVDRALLFKSKIDEFLRQGINEPSQFEETLKSLFEVIE